MVIMHDCPLRERYVAARINPAAPGGRGATTGGGPAAWADSKKKWRASSRTLGRNSGQYKIVRWNVILLRDAFTVKDRCEKPASG
jgi:hypothetical protein